MTRIALRCDGDAELGAGHVGRCVPIARALRDAVAIDPRESGIPSTKGAL